MYRAFDILDEINSSQIENIVVKVDPDVDGYTSAAIFASWLQKYAPPVNVEYVFSKGKCHGFIREEIDDAAYERADLIVIPDAGSDAQSLNHAREFVETHPNAEVLIVDHHPMPMDDDYWNLPSRIVFVNSHHGQGNNVLTGAGMMYTLITNYLAECFSEPSKEWEDHLLKLCALGLVADVADLRDLEARALVYEGIERIKNELETHYAPPSLIAALYEANRYSIRHGMNINAIGWYIAPPMNAVIRMGTQQDKEDLFKALVWGCDEQVDYIPTSGKNKGIAKKVSFQEDMARRAKNIKSRQDTATRKLMREYLKQLSQDETDDSFMVAILRDEVEEKYMPLTGLIANKLTLEIQKPVLLLTKMTDDDGKEYYIGSGRGYEPIGIPDFNGALRKTHLQTGTAPIVLGGHPNAFGYAARKDDLEAVMENINKQYADKNLIPGFPVEYELESKVGIAAIAKDLGIYYDLWGNQVVQPRFAITNVRVPAQDVHCSSNGQTIYFTCDGLQYSKKYCNKNEYEELMSMCHTGLGMSDKEFEFTIIGVFDTYENSSGEEVVYLKVEKWNPIARNKKEHEIEF